MAFHFPKGHVIRVEMLDSEYKNKRLELGSTERDLLEQGVGIRIFCKKCKRGFLLKPLGGEK
jgi:hypothetical protein